VTIAEDVLGELEVHAQLEEQIFYPAIADQSDEGERLAQGSLEEHQILRHLIQELRAMGPHVHGFDAKFRDLIHNVEDHCGRRRSRTVSLCGGDLAGRPRRTPGSHAGLQGAALSVVRSPPFVPCA